MDIPNRKHLKTTDGFGVDVITISHQAILEDIPPSEIDELKRTVADFYGNRFVGWLVRLVHEQGYISF